VASGQALAPTVAPQSNNTAGESRKEAAMPGRDIEFNKKAVVRRFKLVLYENRDFTKGSDKWTITHTTTKWPKIKDDEVAAFKLSGDPGVRVEFFDAWNGSKRKSWAEVELTSAVTSIEVPNMRRSKSTYKHHKVPGEDNIDGKVSLVRVYP
jgi:hypothetical protein